IEGLAPFALAGDTDGVFANMQFLPGEYTLTVTPYAVSGVPSSSGEPQIISFTVIQSCQIAELEDIMLVKGNSTERLLSLTDGMTIDLTQYSNPLNVEAIPKSCVARVAFDLQGPISRTKTEGLAPFALAGDTDGIFAGMQILPGDYMLTVTPYAIPGVEASAGEIQIINFTVTEATPSPSFQLSKASFNPEPQFTLYPIPTQNELTVDMKFFEEGRYSLALYDFTGRIIKTEYLMYDEPGGKNFLLSTSTLSSGVYMIKLSKANFIQWRKITIKR
ncbi:MAG: T9SS type A sorting domain-containing protein, partial [Bacteroidota bacterium]